MKPHFPIMGVGFGNFTHRNDTNPDLFLCFAYNGFSLSFTFFNMT